jgi:uncharacterized repeat protein (TIGR01451 family)
LTLAAGSFSFSYQARIANSATIDLALVNTIGLKWGSIPGGTGAAGSGRTGADGAGAGLNNYATTGSANVTPSGSSFVTPVKSVVTALDVAANNQLDPGDVLTYTVILRNDSTTNIATNVILLDNIPANTSYETSPAVTLVSDIDGLPIGTATYDALNNRIVANGFDMATFNSADRSRRVRLQFNVKINAGTPSGTFITNQASVDTDQTPVTPSNPVTVQTGPVALSNSLYVAKGVVRLTDVAPIAATNGAADIMRYTFVLRNTGTSTLTGVQLQDTIPAGLAIVGGSAVPNTATVSGQNISWATLPNLAPNATQTLTVDVTQPDLHQPSRWPQRRVRPCSF